LGIFFFFRLNRLNSIEKRPEEVRRKWAKYDEKKKKKKKYEKKIL